MNFKDFLNESSGMATVYHVSPLPNLIRLRAERTNAPSGSKLGRGVFVAPKFKDALAWASSYVQFKKKGSDDGGAGPKPYRNLTIYELKIPRGILKTLYYADWWEPEYFVPEELVDQIEIVSSKTMSSNQIHGLYLRGLAQKFSFRKGGSEATKIKELSKTNLAAKLYLSLFERYSRDRMSGIFPHDVMPSGRTLDEEIKKALATLKGMVLKEDPSNLTKQISVMHLDPKEENIARKAHEDAMKIIDAQKKSS